MAGFPPISVRQPVAFDLVDNPVQVAGAGTGFEGVFAARVRDGNGTQLVQVTVNTGGTGIWANYAATLDLGGVPATPQGTLEFSHKKELASAPAGYLPWFDLPDRASRDDAVVIFGHWAALGLLVREDVVCLDSGCVWGRSLTALRLEDRRLFELDCPELEGTSGD